MNNKFTITLASFILIYVILAWFIGYFILRSLFDWRTIVLTLILAAILQLALSLSAKIILGTVLKRSSVSFTVAFGYVFLIMVFYAIIAIFIYFFSRPV